MLCRLPSRTSIPSWGGKQSLGELERHLAAMDASVAASSSGGGDGASSGAPLQSSSPLPADMEDALANGLRHMSGRVGAHCRERRAVVSHQLRLLEGLAAPPHTRVLMWLAVQVSLVLRMIFRCIYFFCGAVKADPCPVPREGLAASPDTR